MQLTVISSMRTCSSGSMNTILQWVLLYALSSHDWRPSWHIVPECFPHTQLMPLSYITRFCKDPETCQQLFFELCMTLLADGMAILQSLKDMCCSSSTEACQSHHMMSLLTANTSSSMTSEEWCGSNGKSRTLDWWIGSFCFNSHSE